MKIHYSSEKYVFYGNFSRYGNQMGNMNRFGNMGMGQKFPRLGMNGHGQQWNQMQNNNPQNLQKQSDSGKSLMNF